MPNRENNIAVLIEGGMKRAEAERLVDAYPEMPSEHFAEIVRELHKPFDIATFQQRTEEWLDGKYDTPEEIAKHRQIIDGMQARGLDVGHHHKATRRLSPTDLYTLWTINQELHKHPKLHDFAEMVDLVLAEIRAARGGTHEGRGQR